MARQGDTGNDERIVVHVDEELKDLIPGFLRNRKADVDAVRSALNKGDFEAIRGIGHSMKGVGGGYGFDFISDIGRALELSARDKNREESADHIDRLAHFLDSVEVIYDPA